MGIFTLDNWGRGGLLLLFLFFFLPKSPLAAEAVATAAGRGKKMLKSFLAAVLPSALVKRFFVSRTRDFLL